MDGQRKADSPSCPPRLSRTAAVSREQPSLSAMVFVEEVGRTIRSRSDLQIAVTGRRLPRNCLPPDEPRREQKGLS
jgi:hypothetical protein